jgi:cytochrome b
VNLYASHLHRTRIWDLPTRLFHWALVVSVVGLVVTGNIGGSAMVWHFRFGQAVLALLMFRLLWGLIGGHWSRFSNFIVHPMAVLSELRGRGRPEWHTGHSALGSLAVIAFVLVLLAQVGSGLVSDDAIAFAGPLTHLVSSAIVSQASAYHKEVGKLLLIGLVLLHVLAIIWHTFKGRALVGAMVHGDKPLEQVMPASRDGWRQRLLAAIVMVLCVAASAWVFSLAPTF